MRTDAAFWTKIAPKYARDPIKDMESYEYTLGRTRSYLKPTDTVLELGCGTGSTALLLAPSVAHITASDYAEGMLDVGREKARKEGIDNITFANVDVSTPMADQTYDAVLAFNLFHLVRDMDAGFADVHKRLKPGGLFITKTPCLAQGGLGWKFGLLKLMIPLMQLVGKAPFVAMLTIEQLEAAMTGAGFEIIESGNFPASPPARYLVARRV